MGGVTCAALCCAVIVFAWNRSHGSTSVAPAHVSVVNVTSTTQDGSSIVYQNPYESPQELMQGIYDADNNVVPPDGLRIRGVIVPHHLVATESIASGIKMLQHQKFKKILLLSPDHFFHCPTVLCTVDATYKTWFGDVHSSADTLAALHSSKLVSDAPDLFKTEHGIYAVLPFIARYYPNIPVTPLVISQKIPWKANRQELLDLIEKSVDDDTILIVSSDFSHYLSLTTAQQMDEVTAETIFAKDLDGISNLKNPSQSDCPGCLWMMASLADARGFYNPSIVLHTNSATILKDPKIPTTTSHFSMVWYENAKLASTDLAVAGDVTVTRNSRVPKQPKVVTDWWAGDGLRFVNLEGPLGAKCVKQSAWYLFCNSVSLWTKMKDLATQWGYMNNHTMDRGVAGFVETPKLISDAGETPVGIEPWENGSVRLIAFTMFLNGVPESGKMNIAGDEQKVLKSLQEKKPNELTVVLVHGGDEYHALLRDPDEKFLRSLIDAGADVVVLAHSHVVGDMEMYKGKPIFRGVGNFIFDQKDRIETSTTKMIRLRKAGESVEFETLVAREP